MNEQIYQCLSGMHGILAHQFNGGGLSHER